MRLSVRNGCSSLERMADFLRLLCCSAWLSERCLWAGFISEVLGLGRNLLESRTLLLAPVGAVSIEPSLLAVQQVAQLVLLQQMAEVEQRRGIGRGVHAPDRCGRNRETQRYRRAHLRRLHRPS